MKVVAIGLLLPSLLTGCLLGRMPRRASDAPGQSLGRARVLVNARGRIGPLHVGSSDRGAVIALAGNPEAERRGRYADFPPFDALGYGCRGKTPTDPAGVPRCKTVFYVDSRSRKLALLYTEDARYVDPHGVYAGLPTRVAERRLRRRPVNGCFSGFRFVTKHAFLVMWLQGGKARVGDHVGFLVVHSQRLNPGVLDCIDS